MNLESAVVIIKKQRDDIASYRTHYNTLWNEADDRLIEIREEHSKGEEISYSQYRELLENRDYYSDMMDDLNHKLSAYNEIAKILEDLSKEEN